MNIKLIAIVTFIVLLVCVTFWQFYLSSFEQIQQGYIDNSTIPTGASDTIKDISSDLDQIPNDSYLGSELNSLNESIGGF